MSRSCIEVEVTEEYKTAFRCYLTSWYTVEEIIEEWDMDITVSGLGHIFRAIDPDYRKKGKQARLDMVQEEWDRRDWPTKGRFHAHMSKVFPSYTVGQGATNWYLSQIKERRLK